MKMLLGKRYRLYERVGGGGMGDVWRGHDERLNRIVAVKILHSTLASNAVFRRRFQLEAHALAQLRAPGVVDVYDYGEDVDCYGTDVCYLVMEYVPGRTLFDVLTQRTRIDPATVVSIIAQAAQALHSAHEAGVIHRDIKPGNILLDEHGWVTVVDFGIAAAQGESGLTASGTIMGTTSYVSPEQLNNADATAASDIYALGVVAYECLTGERPFTGDSPAVIIAGHLNSPPAPLPEYVPSDIRDLVMRALAKSPANRWPTASAFAQACRNITSGEITLTEEKTGAAQDTSIPTTQTRHRDSIVSHHGTSMLRARAILAAAVITLVLLAVSAFYWHHSTSTPSADRLTEHHSSTTHHGKAPSQAKTSNSHKDPESKSPSQLQPKPPHTTSPSADKSTSTPDLEQVPNVVKLSPDDAESTLKSHGFNSITTNSGSGTYPCTVEKQRPGANKKVAPETVVEITVHFVPEGQSCP